MVELRWAAAPLPPQTYEGVHALVAAVAAAGGAVGWLYVPDRAETAAWVDGVLADGARLLLAYDGGVVVGSGHWVRLTRPVMRHNAEVHKVMVLPSGRGRGVARAVTAALVADATASGVEVLGIDCRGNNHAALGPYSDLGFVVTGRRPDWIAVGDERFDQVLLHLDLRPRRPQAHTGLVRHGGRREGPGST